MITDKKVKELIKKAHEVAKDSFKPREIVNEIFYNLKAHLQANKTIEELIEITNNLLVKHGEAIIHAELSDENIKVLVAKKELNPIPKHFDFDTDDLFYVMLDYLSQIYEEGEFSASIVFLNKERTEAEVHVTL